jgi:hypothetical protein
MRFDLSDQMTMTVLNALSNHPYREAAPVIAEMQRQANSQRPQGNGAEHTSDNRDAAVS